MTQNAMTTTMRESKHLTILSFISHVDLYGILPSVLVLWVRVKQGSGPGHHGVDEACLRVKTAEPASHDNLFQSIPALMDISTSAGQDGLDLTVGCFLSPS